MYRREKKKKSFDPFFLSSSFVWHIPAFGRGGGAVNINGPEDKRRASTYYEKRKKAAPLLLLVCCCRIKKDQR